MSRLALSVCVVAFAGCMTTRSRPAEYLAEQSAATAAAARADLDAGRTTGARGAATMVYWLWLKDALHPPVPKDATHPTPIDPKAVARAIDSLPTTGVDPQLLKQGQLVAEKMRVQGFHYPFPSLAYVEKAGDGYREIPVIWNPAI